MIQKFKENYPDTFIYEESVIEDGNNLYFIIQDQTDRYLIVLSKKENSGSINFAGENVETNGSTALKCPLNHQNASILRDKFPFTKPVLLGKQSSYGLGDRLGNAGVAHLKSIRKTSFRPVLAQQSIRELQRTNRTAEEVMDAASWAVFQTGFRGGFGADGDHLKTKQDIDLMVKAGYTMFTIDPSDYVVNEAGSMDQKRLNQEFLALPWSLLDIDPEGLLKRYAGKEIKLSRGIIEDLSEEMIMGSLVKYGRVISHTKVLSDYLSDEHTNHPAELELSVDETDEPTTLFEHYLIASELTRLDVELVSLAPRFCGDFEKGIDFKGDIEQFKREYSQHLAIAEAFGGYKLSIHSGSDKFSVYEAIGSLNQGSVHVKTAGTSYLEALRTIAEADPELFREILTYSKDRFEEDKKTYHISGKPGRIPSNESLKDSQLKKLLDDNDARQVLHVTYGSVLNGTDQISAAFKARLMDCLKEHKDLYEKNLEIHFDKHLAPFL